MREFQIFIFLASDDDELDVEEEFENDDEGNKKKRSFMYFLKFLFYFFKAYNLDADMTSMLLEVFLVVFYLKKTCNKSIVRYFVSCRLVE